MNAFYRFSNDINEVRKYTDNPNARGALFNSTDTNKVYIMNTINEVLEVVDTNDTVNTLNELVGYIKKHAESDEKLPTNCVNCGAVLTSNKCEYCGTIYR